MRPWAIVRFCLATVLSCLAVIALFLAWINSVDDAEPGSVQLLISGSLLIAMVLGTVGIFFVLVFMPNPNRRSVHQWRLARSCLATILGCCTGTVLFFVWFAVSYGNKWGVAEVLVGSGVLLAMVLSVVGLFSALVFGPSQPGAALSATTVGWAPDPSGRFELRYFEGATWTEHVATDGRPAEDPLA